MKHFWIGFEKRAADKNAPYSEYFNKDLGNMEGEAYISSPVLADAETPPLYRFNAVGAQPETRPDKTPKVYPYKGSAEADTLYPPGLQRGY